MPAPRKKGQKLLIRRARMVHVAVNHRAIVHFAAPLGSFQDSFGYFLLVGNVKRNGGLPGARPIRPPQAGVSSEFGNGVVADAVLIEDEAEAGPVGNRDQALRIDRECLAEHLVPAGGGEAARWVVRKLQP